jgi:purine-binding chemotaxis protein CheW
MSTPAAGVNATNLPQPGANSSTTARRGGKYLTFELGREEFGIEVLRVREIMGLQEITAVPHAPHYTKGVINLRGKVIPVVDLRLKFGMSAVDYTQRTCIIVTEVHAPAESRSVAETEPLLVGAVVDGVSEVLNLAASDIEDTPDFGGEVSTAGLLGMAKSKGRVKILIDIDEVMNSQDLKSLGALIQ